jgi:hypothetical protein
MSGTILAFSEDITNAPPPTPLPVGPYPAEIIGAQKRMSTSGNEYVQIMMRINAESTLLTSRTVILMAPHSATTGCREDNGVNRHRWRVFMEKCGGPLGRNIDLGSLIGLTCTVEITHQEYEGEQRAQIARVLAP